MGSNFVGFSRNPFVFVVVSNHVCNSISMASTVFHHFVASDNASESFANMKRIHGLMPYFMLKAALKISNPVAMIRGRELALLREE